MNMHGLQHTVWRLADEGRNIVFWWPGALGRRGRSRALCLRKRGMQSEYRPRTRRDEETPRATEDYKEWEGLHSGPRSPDHLRYSSTLL